MLNGTAKNSFDVKVLYPIALLAALLHTSAGDSGAFELPYLSSDPEVLCTVLERDGTAALYEGDIDVGTCRQDSTGRWSFTPAGALGYSLAGLVPRGALLLASWPDATLPYTIDSTLEEATAPAAFQDIKEAIRHWNDVSGIRVIPRTVESDYVVFRAGSGCSSSVGRVGGSQSIRLLSSGGCGFGSTVHEIGHALGYYHEQSRQDRDTYVTINYANITPGREHNFNKYSLGSAFDDGPYDYGSIMHYGGGAFSVNDQATIVPNEPQYSDWQAINGPIEIGNRRALSPGDDASANYYRDFCFETLPSGSAYWKPTNWSRCKTGCAESGRSRVAHCIDSSGACGAEAACDAGSRPHEAETCAAKLSCNFEIFGCGWDHSDREDDFDWTIAIGPTASSGTGPAVDHTRGTQDGGYYYIETSSPRVSGNQAFLTSMPVDTSAGSSISFWYHSFGDTVQPLILEEIPCDTGAPVTLWTSDGASADVWRNEVIALNARANVRYRFVATVGGSFTGDVAIDDIVFTQGIPPSTTSTSTTSTSSTSTTTELPVSTTTTTLAPNPVVCAPAPVDTCIRAGESKLHYQAKKAGYETLRIQFNNFEFSASMDDFGDVFNGATVIQTCIYDDNDALVSQLTVDRSGDLCGKKPCWKPKGFTGAAYRDKTSASDGISKMRLQGGLKKERIQISGANKSSKGQNSLPTNILNDLATSVAPTVQVLSSEASCFTTTFTRAIKVDGSNYLVTNPAPY